MTLLSTKQVAKYYGVSPRTLEAWRITGQGPQFCKIGKLVRYDQSAIDAWANSNQRNNTSATNTTKITNK